VHLGMEVTRAIFVLALTVIVSLACAAAWTAVRHVALGGASPR
jgi:hypothetical protein